MEIRQVTNDDGRACANLIRLLTTGRWELSGDEAASFMKTKQWVHDIAIEMAGQLKSQTTSQPAPAPMKIRNMGPIGKPKRKK